MFHGEEIRIESVVCSFFDEVIDVATVSEAGHRVLIGAFGSSSLDAQVLDPDGLPWLPQMSSDDAQRDGNTFTSDPALYSTTPTTTSSK